MIMFRVTNLNEPSEKFPKKVFETRTSRSDPWIKGWGGGGRKSRPTRVSGTGDCINNFRLYCDSNNFVMA